MIADSDRYTGLGLVEDMLAVPDLIRAFDADQMHSTAEQIGRIGRLLMTGEGSSRLFPAKNAIACARRQGWPLSLQTEAGLQAQEYDLAEWAVFGLSNSGRTAEVIGLFEQLQQAEHPCKFSLTAHADTKLESLATTGYVLTCGEEHAVAATKSVIEQALFLHALLERAAGKSGLAAGLSELADSVGDALAAPIEPSLVDRIAGAETIYWAGRNDGVAEELTLKTNEITRKPADFLEGTYAVHGIEEVMNAGGRRDLGRSLSRLRGEIPIRSRRGSRTADYRHCLTADEVPDHHDSRRRGPRSVCANGCWLESPG